MARLDLPAPARRILLATLAGTLFLQAMREFFSQVYYHNLIALGMSPMAAFAALLLAPAVLLVPRVASWPRLVSATAIALVLARVMMALTRGESAGLVFAGVATAAFLVLLPGLVRQGAATAAGGLALAVALDAALVVAGTSADPTVGIAGLWFAVPAGAAVMSLASSLPLHDAPASTHAPVARTPWGAALALVAWVFLQFSSLGAPYHLASWNGLPVEATAAAVLGGLVGGVLFLRFGERRQSSRLVALIALAGLAGLIDHGWIHSAAMPVLMAFAQAALVVALARACSRLANAERVRAARAYAAASPALPLLLFAFVFAFVFAYVPLGDLWKGKAPFLLVLAYVGALWPLRDVVARERLRLPRMDVPRVPVAGLMVACVGLAAIALVPPDGPPPAPRDDALRVMTFNVHQAFDNAGVIHPEIFVEVLREVDPDVVVLQESDTARFTSANVDIVRYLAEELRYHYYHGQPTWTQSVGMAVLSKHPVQEAGFRQLTSFSDNRFAVAVKLHLPEQDAWFVGVHMGLPARDRSAQVQEVLDYAASLDGPRVLLGDFNSCPTGRCPSYEGERDRVYERVTAQYHDAWVETGRAPDDPDGRTFDASQPFERIDYVFVSDAWDVLDAQVVRTPATLAASDHLPVVADLRLVQSP